MDELVIKVPAPSAALRILDSRRRYPAQERSEPLRDIPFFVEGPAGPMQLLVERLALFADKDRIVGSHAADDQYSWTLPLQLTDEVCVLAFQDRSMRAGETLLESADTAQAVRGYIWNLVRPMAFTFLRDCVRIGGLRLSSGSPWSSIPDTRRQSTSSCSARRSLPRTATGCSSRL